MNDGCGPAHLFYLPPFPPSPLPPRTKTKLRKVRSWEGNTLQGRIDRVDPLRTVPCSPTFRSPRLITGQRNPRTRGVMSWRMSAFTWLNALNTAIRRTKSNKFQDHSWSWCQIQFWQMEYTLNIFTLLHTNPREDASTQFIERNSRSSESGWNFSFTTYLHHTPRTKSSYKVHTVHWTYVTNKFTH
jgi:hypothetical protein